MPGQEDGLPLKRFGRQFGKKKNTAHRSGGADGEIRQNLISLRMGGIGIGTDKPHVDLIFCQQFVQLTRLPLDDLPVGRQGSLLPDLVDRGDIDIIDHADACHNVPFNPRRRWAARALPVVTRWL